MKPVDDVQGLAHGDVHGHFAHANVRCRSKRAFMEHEMMTFGTSGLDRAAELRGQAAELWAAGQGRTVLFWRGKALMAGNRLARLPLDHPVLATADDRSIFLGRDAGLPIFATDISIWQPSGDTEQVGQFVDDSQQVHPDLPDMMFCELRQVMTVLDLRDGELAATGKAILEWHRSHRYCSKCGNKSAVSMGGWERTCLACDAKHFPRTDPVVIMLITRGNKVLIGRSHFWPEGMYSLLAGFVEPGETIEAAVRREVVEESSIRVGKVSYIASQPWPFPNSLMFGCRGEALNEDISIDPDEIEDAIWVSREELATAFAGEHATIKPARKGAIAHYLLHLWLADKLD